MDGEKTIQVRIKAEHKVWYDQTVTMTESQFEEFNELEDDDERADFAEMFIRFHEVFDSDDLEEVEIERV